MDFRDQTIENQDVTLDGNSFMRCTFRNCRMIFRASASSHMESCQFLDGVTFHMEGAADLTMQFLTACYHGMGDGGRDLVENTFRNIRAGRPPAPPTRH